MRKFVALIVTFIFIYPIFIKYLPIPLDRVFQIFGFVLLIFNKFDFTRIFANRNVFSFLLATILLFLLALLPQVLLPGVSDYYFVKTVFDTFLSFFSAYFVYHFVRKIGSENTFSDLIQLIVIASIIQTIVSLVFFLSPNLFDIYSNILNEDANEKLLSRSSTLNKRFIGIGSQFFSGVIKYGFAFFCLLILPYISPAKWVKNKFLYGASIAIVGVGGLLTGRTFFVAILLGLIMLMIINSKSVVHLIRLNIKIFFSLLILIPIIYYIALITIDPHRLEIINNYVFEIFINLFSEGSLSTSSSDTTLSMYVFPETNNTWFFGDGKIMEEDGSYYMGTDVGYIRLLFYFGLPSTLVFIYVLLKYQSILRRLTLSRPLKIFFFIIGVWILVLNFKGLTLDTQYFVIFLLFLVLSNFRFQFNN